MLLSIASICYVFCAIPQLVRNLRFKDTITQSLLSNILILFATCISLVAYVNLELFSSSVFLVIEISLTIVLIIQIMIWRKHRNSRKIKKMVENTEGARSLVRSIKGVK